MFFLNSSDVRFGEVETFHMFNRSWEITTRIMSARIKHTRTGDVIYRGIFVDVEVSIPYLIGSKLLFFHVLSLSRHLFACFGNSWRQIKSVLLSFIACRSIQQRHELCENPSNIHLAMNGIDEKNRRTNILL